MAFCAPKCLHSPTVTPPTKLPVLNKPDQKPPLPRSHPPPPPPIETSGRKKSKPYSLKILRSKPPFISDTNLVFYSKRIDTLCRSGQTEEALRLLRAMEDSNNKHLFPDTVTYNTLINGLCRDGQLEAALRSSATCEPAAARLPSSPSPCSSTASAPPAEWTLPLSALVTWSARESPPTLSPTLPSFRGSAPAGTSTEHCKCSPR